jgi:hypothetical protein
LQATILEVLQMKIAMLRVGIDMGAGGILGPLFKDGTFEYIPIPDGFGRDERTYGNTTGSHGLKLLDFFPVAQRARVSNQSIHFDPEFATFTYGDPTSPKAGLRHLQEGDMLVFYCGMEGWDFKSPPSLYLIGYFEVLVAGKATAFSSTNLQRMFSENYHVRHRDVYERQKEDLVLVKGSSKSRFLNKAICISSTSRDRSGRPLKVLSTEMQSIFGNFNGKISFQRSPTRWVDPAYVARAAEFVWSL